MSKSGSGILYALAAFSFWGVVPVYFKLIEQFTAMEVLAHRVVWSVLILTVLTLLTRQWHEIQHILTSSKALKALLVSSILIAINWLTFIWAVSHSKVLEVSLGYFINPLISIILGLIFFKEKLSSRQWVAVIIVSVALALELIKLGAIPITTLILALSFGLYGLIRKKADLAAIPGLAVETCLLLPIFSGYLVWQYQLTTGAPQLPEAEHIFLLALAGPITALPLLWFNAAATRLKLSTLGLMQYIGPTISFLIAIFLFNEELPEQRMITFSMVWLALLIASFPLLKNTVQAHNKAT